MEGEHARASGMQPQGPLQSALAVQIGLGPPDKQGLTPLKDDLSEAASNHVQCQQTEVLLVGNMMASLRSAATMDQLQRNINVNFKPRRLDRRPHDRGVLIECSTVPSQFETDTSRPHLEMAISQYGTTSRLSANTSSQAATRHKGCSHVLTYTRHSF